MTTTDGNGVATDYTKLEYEGRTYPLTPSDTPILSLTGWSPMQVQAGIGWRPGAGLTLTVEELWKRWSEWENFSAVIRARVSTIRGIRAPARR
ncbi:MAG: hypothetical protein M5R36_23315 [Deltaproteobacteria bacterium]|nr:hypothetical protein [Deltaproteobacteria bacterium]